MDFQLLQTHTHQKNKKSCHSGFKDTKVKYFLIYKS